MKVSELLAVLTTLNPQDRIVWGIENDKEPEEIHGMEFVCAQSEDGSSYILFNSPDVD